MEGMAGKLKSQTDRVRVGMRTWSCNTSCQAWPLMDRNLRNNETVKGERNMVHLSLAQATFPKYNPSSADTERNNKWDLLKLRSFCKAKGMVNKTKQVSETVQI